MDYKKYYKEVKERLKEFSDVVYYEPMTEDEILALEKRIGQSFNPLFREFLLAFGMTQDVFEEIQTDIDSFFKDIDFIKDSLDGYLPIYSDIEEEEIIYLINNRDLQDDFVYKVVVDINDKIGKIKKVKPFHEIVEKSLSNLKINHSERCENKDKVNNTEFIFSANGFSEFGKAFQLEGLKQKTEWKSKYYPENIFGDEVAIFKLYNAEIIMERDRDKREYKFEIEEPVLIKKEKSEIHKTEQLLNVHGIKFEKIECKLIG